MSKQIDQLKNFIRKIVEEEVRKIVPQVLTEQYLRNMICENTKSNIPQQIINNSASKHKNVNKNTSLDNLIKEAAASGADFYNKEEPKKQSNVLLNDNNPYKSLFEDTLRKQQLPSTDEELGALQQTLDLDFSKMNRILEGVAKKPQVQAQATDNVEYEMQLKKLEAKRRALEIPVPISK